MLPPKWYSKLFIPTQCREEVTNDSSMITRFVVHEADGTKHMCKPSKKGLFIKQDVPRMLVNTVDSIKNYKQLKCTLIPAKPCLFKTS